jgi:hypothetical protein
MNDKLRTVLKKRYEADIEDAKYKIKCFSEHELVIPEHPDITLEVDKLLQKIAEAEDKLAIMCQNKYYNSTPRVSIGCRLGVEQVSQI